MIWNRGRAVLSLAAAMAAGGIFPLTAQAASPEFSRTEEEWAALRDDTIEYGELADLIHEYNATVQNNAYEYRKFREDYGDTNAEVSSAYYDLAQDFYSDISGDDDAGSMMNDLNLEIQGDSMMKQADETLEDSKIYQLTYEQAEKSLVVTAQSYMISYYQQLLEQEQQQAELANAGNEYELTRTKLAAGTATQLDMLAAQEAVQTAQNQISQLENTIEETRESLIVLLGWKHDDHPVIGAVPEIDLSRIEGMNPDQDLETAIANNYTLQINKRKLENARNQTTKESLRAAIANNERQIGASLSSAYQSVLTAKTAYEQAQAAAALEEENTRVAALRLSAGMMTQAAYDEQVNARDNSQLSAQSAGLELLTAMENYEWAVAGLAAAE
ncbi:MAG TPA: TolC family protein [Candidatus Enterocloster faecavium]|uniref:TolC family protein n=1 Tax=Candidatus Enterocloster faecavium TaxID=2838560 RepID=A0A9D2L9F0_9FIRM|nr:TolC family protein [Candidatus Enterocloster faecavium]